MLSFVFIQEKRKNFTPAWKIWDYCKSYGFKWFIKYGTTYVNFQGGVYTYDHYTINPENEDQERVEIFLKKVS